MNCLTGKDTIVAREVIRLILLVFLFLSCKQSYAYTLEAGGYVPQKSVKLSTLSSKFRTGLAYDVEPASAMARLRKQAEVYINFRKNRLSQAQQLALYTNCLADPDENVFCKFLPSRMKEKKQPKKSRSIASVRSGPSPTVALADAIESADLKKIQAVKNPRYFRALRQFKDWKRLEKITVKILDDGEQCFPSEFLLPFALKAEEFFPEERYKLLAINIYTRALECASEATDEEIIDLVHLRLSLLHIWRKDCKKAEPYLQILSQNKDGTFLTRALYWQAQCAKMDGDEAKSLTVTDELLRVNPIGYHSIVLNKSKTERVLQSVYSADPWVRFRTKVKPELNDKVRMVEILTEMDAMAYADDILRSIIKKSAGTEPGFNLYMAILAQKSSSAIMPFQIISKIFQYRPDMISADVLRIFFPLKHFDMIWAQRTIMDPYFIAALIRQESGFDMNARSNAGAMGLMQLLPGTAKRIVKITNKKLLKPDANINTGVRFLSQLLKLYDGDAELALAAYNAGENNVDEWLHRYPTSNRMLFLDLIPFSETRNYVALIARNYYWYLSLYGPRNLSLGSDHGRNPASPAVKVEFRGLHN